MAEQNTPNDNVENRNVTVEVEDENSEVKNNSNSSINNVAGPTSSAGETVEVEVSTKKVKKPHSGPKEVAEGNPYDQSKSITDRVNTAVKKYRKEHTFTFLSNQMFTSYLNFGGITTNQNQEHGNEDDVEVDFTYTVRVYLSGFLIDQSGYVHMDNFREAPRVVISFLNFLLENRVFPEFEDDIQEALRIAHKANDELPNCKALDLNAPGKFNKACSLLFGGELYGALDDTFVGEELAVSMIGISKEEGRRLIEKVFGVNSLKELKQVKEDSRYNIACEIIKVEPFQTDISKAFANENQNPSTTGTQSVNGENSDPNNNTLVDETNLKKIMLRECNVDKAEPFYVSECSDVVNRAMPGMFITADFHKLSNGFLYWDSVTNIYPSYYLMCDEDD